MVSAPLWLKSDRTRRIVCLVCFFLVEVFVLINLVMSSDHPTAALSWTTLEGGNTQFYLGLRTFRWCILDICTTRPMTSATHSPALHSPDCTPHLRDAGWF